MADRDAIEAIVQAAYSIYIDRIGQPPGPMLDDYAARIAGHAAFVGEEADGTIVGVLVLLAKPDHLLLDNVAVRPDRQGRGIGRALVGFAEAEARRRGFGELRLYTHEMMTENVALYRRLGFMETGRGQQAGFARVFMRKAMNFP